MKIRLVLTLCAGLLMQGAAFSQPSQPGDGDRGSAPVRETADARDAPRRSGSAEAARGAGETGPARQPFRSPALLDAKAKRELEVLRDKANEGTVGVVAGGIDGTYLRVVTELATVLAETDGDVRVLPIAGKGSLQNIWDIVFTRGVDAGLVQSDVLAYAKREKIFPAIDAFIQFISYLYEEEVHVLASDKIKKIEDLAFKKVNFDRLGSGTYMTANVLFGELKFPVEATTFDQALALEKLKGGEIDAMLYVAGKPTPLFQSLTPEDGLHFLSIPPTPELEKIYSRATLTTAEYPSLVQGAAVETLSVGAVLAVYAWTPDSERYHKVARFVNAFFSRSSLLQQKPRHPKWHELSLATAVPGWTRFSPATTWLRNAALASHNPRDRDQFEVFLEKVSPGRATTPEQREALFGEYLQWAGARVADAASGVAGHGSSSSGRVEQRAELPVAADALKQIQAALQERGLYKGPVDGVMGPETKRAIAAYQQRHGLAPDAALNLQTLQSLAATAAETPPVEVMR